MDNRRRIRTRCKSCKKRVYLKYNIANGRFYCICPNCGSHGDLRLQRKQ